MDAIGDAGEGPDVPDAARLAADVRSTPDRSGGGGSTWHLALLACVFLSAHACIALTRQTDGLAAIWLPNAILLAALLRRPRRDWRAIVCWGAFALLLANIANGRDLALSLGLPACNLVEVILGALALRRLRDASFHLDLASPRPLAAFLALALGPAPFVSGVLAACLLHATHGLEPYGVLRPWFAAHAVGLLTLVPLLVTLDPATMLGLFRRGARLRTASCLLLLSGALAAVFMQDRYPLLFLVFPPLMLINFQLGFAGVVLALAMTVAAAVGATQAGTGPLLLVHGGLRDQMLVLQGFVAVAGLTSLQLASVLAARARLEEALRRANGEAAAEIVARRASEAAAGTARREAERAREQALAAREEALAASRAKSDFLAAMSHEIRTPLNSIIGFTGLMLDDPSLHGLLRQRAGVVASAGTALLGVVDDVLDMARIEAGRIDLDAAPFSPRTLFSDAVALLEGQAAAKGIALAIHVGQAVPDRLVGDAGRLQQVLLNLLNNAVKFTDRGSVTLDAAAEDEEDGVRLRVAVADTGPGIDPEAQERLFQRFSQADPTVARRYGGSGLGLAICRQLVALMGGTIGVASEVGRGSTFSFTVRLAQAAEAVAPPAPQPVEAPRAGRLLVVEDVPVNQLLARALLEADGHHVTVVDGAEAAIAAVRRGAYDLVLMDVRLPGLDGLAATRAIRALPAGRDLPVVAMTANVCADEIAAVRAAGMIDHVAKPIDRAQLRAVLARHLPAASGTPRADAGPSLAAAPAFEAPVFETETFEHIAAVLGPERTRGTLLLLRRDLAIRLVRTDSAETLREDAHVVTAIAGTFGFAALSRCCSRLAAAPADEPIDPGEIALLLRAKAETLSQLALLLPEEPAARAA